MKHKPNRAGYAMLLVLAFLVVFFSLLAMTYSQLASSLRVEAVRAKQLQREEGSLHALARGLALLETGYPSTDPYVCGVTIDTSTGSHSFTVTFASEGGGAWSLHSAPTAVGQNPEAMPLEFTSQSPP
jgi:hypothetical protein